MNSLFCFVVRVLTLLILITKPSLKTVYLIMDSKLIIFAISRFKESKSKPAKDNEVFDAKKDYGNGGINIGYRDSKEIKRLLSTNASSERYSNIPISKFPTFSFRINIIKW